MNYLQPDRLDALARDYTLGTMQAGARRRFERLLHERPAAMLAVGAWQSRLDTLAASVPPRAPRPAVWSALEQRLFAPRAKPLPGWRQWLAGRAFGSALGGALAGLLLAVVVLQQQPDWIGLEPAQQALPQSYVGLLVDAEGRPGLLASSRRHGRVLTVKMLQPLAVPAGRVAQLWALPRDGSAPFPVGTVPAQGQAPVALADDAEKLFFGVARLAVSLEPAPAAPGTTPSAPFVLSGHCVKLW